MRTARGNHLKAVTYSADRIVSVLLLVLIVISSISFQFALAARASALPVDVPVPESPDSSPDSTEPAPEPVVLRDDTPQATSAAELMPAAAFLTWTPTGTGETEDLYDIKISASDAVNDAGELSGESAVQASGLTTARFDATTLAEGTYYWQVKACPTVGICRDWSVAWKVTIDGTAPEVPQGLATSDMYESTVTFAGLATPGVNVTVTADEQSCEALSDDTGDWACALPESVGYGSYDASITARDAAGNVSVPFVVPFVVKELFVAAPIAEEELPETLKIVPVDETPVSAAVSQPVYSVDTVNMATPTIVTEVAADPPRALQPLSTDGGIVQSSEAGWYVLGMPWFVWAGSVGGLASAWWVFGWPTPRRLVTS